MLCLPLSNVCAAKDETEALTQAMKLDLNHAVDKCDGIWLSVVQVFSAPPDSLLIVWHSETEAGCRVS